MSPSPNFSQPLELRLLIYISRKPDGIWSRGPAAKQGLYLPEGSWISRRELPRLLSWLNSEGLITKKQVVFGVNTALFRQQTKTVCFPSPKGQKLLKELGL